MPGIEEQLKAQVDESIKLTRKMLDTHEGLETRIKKFEEAGLGTADLKEQVQKMATDNAKAVDEIKALTEKLREEVNARQDEFEAKMAKLPSGDGMPVDIAAPLIKSLPELSAGQQGRMGFKEKVKAEVSTAPFLKTVTSLAASAGDAQIPTYEPTIIAPGQQAISLLDVLPQSMTDSPLIYWVVEVLASRTNNADIQSLDFTGTDQGTALGESDFVFNQLSAETRTFGHTAKVAIQIIDDVAQLRGYLENQMRYMVRFDLESQILGGDGTGKNISGLKTQGTAYDVTLDNTLGVTSLQNLDVLRLAILQCALTFFPATGSILHPHEATGLELIKDGDGNYMFVNPAGSNVLRPWGVPVVSTTQQTSGDFTVGAMNHAEVVMRQAVEVLLSTENEDDFDKMLATLRATGRFGLKVYQPGSIIEGDFASAKA